MEKEETIKTNKIYIVDNQGKIVKTESWTGPYSKEIAETVPLEEGAYAHMGTLFGTPMVRIVNKTLSKEEQIMVDALSIAAKSMQKPKI
jgi:hypothetical protein